MASLAYKVERLRPLISALDQPAYWVGKIAAWLIVPLVGVLVYEVISRYIFSAPTAWAYDLTYMAYSALYMLGAAYALGTEAHVRADFLYQYLSPRWQSTIDVCFYVIFFFPALVVFTWLTASYALASWAQGERIITSPWMPVIYPLKTVMPVTGLLLLIQGAAQLLKGFYCIVTNKPYDKDEGSSAIPRGYE